MSPTATRPAWVLPSLLVATFAVIYIVVRLLGADSERSSFPTQSVPAPTASAVSGTPIRPEYGLVLTATGVGPHRFGDAEGPVVEALTAVLGIPTEDAPDECTSGQPARWVRWADLSIRLQAGRFVAYIEGIHYPPGPAPLAIPTAEGLAAGDPAARLFELYDSASLRQVPPPGPSEQEVAQFEIINDGTQPLVVVIEGGPQTGKVVAISAGGLCPSPT